MLLLRTLRRPFSAYSKGLEGKLLIQYTCSHSPCERAEEERTSKKVISKLSYDEGVVLVKCQCDKFHLIADHLGFFEDESKTIEDIMREKGESIRKLTAKEFSIAEDA